MNGVAHGSCATATALAPDGEVFVAARGVVATATARGFVGRFRAGNEITGTCADSDAMALSGGLAVAIHGDTAMAFAGSFPGKPAIDVVGTQAQADAVARIGRVQTWMVR